MSAMKRIPAAHAWAAPLRPLVFALFPALVAVAPAAVAAKGEALDPQKAGIAVYPGAKPDAGTTDFLRTSLEAQGAAYRSGDDVGKVAAFYGKQAGVKPMGAPTKESAAFTAGCKEEYNTVLKKKMTTGCDFHITVQSPWQDMKSGKMVSDTLITIVKQQ